MKLGLFFLLSLNLIFSMIPIPAMLINCWPVWLVLFFYGLNIFFGSRHPFFWIWGLGLVFDLLQGSSLGVHVMALSMVNILLSAHRHKFLYYPILQQSMLVFLGTGISTLCLASLFSNGLYLALA
jgi:rod shape-determining protein MreD